MTGIGGNYGGALYSLARDEGLAAQILEQLKVLDTAFTQEPAFLHLLATPNLSKAERCGIVDESFRGKVHPYVLNLLKLLAEKGHVRLFGDCVKAYRQQYNGDNGIISVLAVSAVALSEDQTQRLHSKLEAVTGKKIELRCRVDESCIGGVRLDYDGRRVDGTVKNRLDSMGEMLRGNLWN